MHMTSQDRLRTALDLARQGKFYEARSLLDLIEMGGRIPEDEMRRAWAKFSKYWRGE